MKQLGKWFNPDANAIVNANHKSGREKDEDEEDKNNDDKTNDIANLLINGSHFRTERVFLAKNESVPDKQQFTEPTTFAEAWHDLDENKRKLWRKAIRVEFRSMIKQEVWQKVKRSTIPNGKPCVKCKWVFKIKRDGRHKARLVACGCNQVPGIDLEESYAPVLNGVSFRIILIAAIVWKLDIKVIDIETAFLHGNLDGMEVYMDCPQGLEGAQPDGCLLL